MYLNSDRCSKIVLGIGKKKFCGTIGLTPHEIAPQIMQKFPR